MTFDEIVDNALARAFDFGQDFPTTRRVLYRRIQVREQQLFTEAGRVNPDYFGVNVAGALSPTGDVNMQDLDVEGAVLDPASSITRVEILDPGSHPTLQCGDEVDVISVHDADAGIAPRMWLRNFTLHAYKGDMDGVTSICIYYSYRPAPRPAPLDGTETSELPSMHQELLVIDLTKWLLKQSISMAPETKSAALGVLGSEEEELGAVFMAEVGDYAGGQVSRFGDVRGSQRL